MENERKIKGMEEANDWCIENAYHETIVYGYPEKSHIVIAGAAF